MTGPEHYREAERLLAVTPRAVIKYDGELTPERAAGIQEKIGEGTLVVDKHWEPLNYDKQLQRAQVHATLAVAAASAPGWTMTQLGAWREVLS